MVKMEETGYPHGLDEKNMPYRKRTPSDIHASEEMMSNEDENSSQAEASNADGEEEPVKFERLKEKISNFLEGLDEDELTYIKIEH